jgi:hypothetical protein
MARERLEAWGGEVHLPRWSRLRHTPELGHTRGWHEPPGQKHYRRKP